MSKWIGGFVTLIVPFLLTALAGAVIVMTQRNVGLSDAQWGRLLLIICLALLYVAAVYSLAIFVSCLTARASTSVMVLLSVWVLGVLAIPNLSPHIAQIIRPAANAQEVESARTTATTEIWERIVEDGMRAYDKEHGFGDRWWEDINWSDWEDRKRGNLRRSHELALEREAHMQRLNEYAKIDQRYDREMDAQIALTKWIGRVSPFCSFALAATELADCGVMEKVRVMQQLRTYQATLCVYAYDEWEAINQYELEHRGDSQGPWHEHRVKSVPIFYYVPPAARDYARLVALDGGILAGMALLFFMLGYMKFLRYDVR